MALRGTSHGLDSTPRRPLAKFAMSSPRDTLCGIPQIHAQPFVELLRLALGCGPGVRNSKIVQEAPPLAVKRLPIATLRVSIQKRPPGPLVEWILLHDASVEVDRSLYVGALTTRHV